MLYLNVHFCLLSRKKIFLSQKLKSVFYNKDKGPFNGRGYSRYLHSNVMTEIALLSESSLVPLFAVIWNTQAVGKKCGPCLGRDW